jgi:hypothetical protein
MAVPTEHTTESRKFLLNRYLEQLLANGNFLNFHFYYLLKKNKNDLSYHTYN